MSADTIDHQFVYVPRAALTASFLLHLLIPVGWLTVKTLDYLGLHLFPKTHIRDLYQEYVQVDLVGLPDVAVKDLPTLDATLPTVDKPAASPQASEKPDDQMILQAERQSAAKKAEREAQLKKLMADEERKKALKQVEQDLKREQALKALAEIQGKKGRDKLKGNIVSQGTAVVGNLGTPKDRYTAIVMAKIKEKFYIMPSQRNRGLSNTVHIDLFPTGRVRARRFIQRSADKLFDSAVMQAIEEAQPLPLPDDLSLIQGGITVNFRAEEQ